MFDDDFKEGWSRWYAHDGRPCPVKGQLVESILANGHRAIHIAGSYQYQGKPGNNPTDLWDWKMCRTRGAWDCRVIAYRIKKSKGFELLEELVREYDNEAA